MGLSFYLALRSGKHMLQVRKAIMSGLLMAEIDPSEPWKLISDPIILSSPEYDWEKVNGTVNEGPAVLCLCFHIDIYLVIRYLYPVITQCLKYIGVDLIFKHFTLYI